MFRFCNRVERASGMIEIAQSSRSVCEHAAEHVNVPSYYTAGDINNNWPLSWTYNDFEVVVWTINWWLTAA